MSKPPPAERRSLPSSQEALDAMLEEQLPGLHEFIRLRAGRFLRSREDSTDLVQSTCREILQHLDRFHYDNPDAFKRWLYATALRKILDRVRYWRAEKRLAPEDTVAPDSPPVLDPPTFATPSRDAMTREELDQTQRAFAVLPRDYQTVIFLARMRGLPHARIAAEMGRTPGAVRILLSRALARLATLVEQGLPPQ